MAVHIVRGRFRISAAGVGRLGRSAADPPVKCFWVLLLVDPSHPTQDFKRLYFFSGKNLANVSSFGGLVASETRINAAVLQAIMVATGIMPKG